MPLSTTQYGYIIDPLVPLTDDTGRTISNGYVRVFVAGTSTPVITFKNFDGATNEETVQLDNSGRTAYPVIGSKGSTYKVCVYDAEHSQETPIKTIDKVVPAGANVEATNIVTGLDNVESPEAGWVKSTVSGTDAEVSLDATNVTSEVDTMVKATAASADYMMPLVHKTGSDPDKKITLGNIFKFVLNFIHSLTDTATESDITSGNYFALDGSAGTKKLNSTTLLTKTAKNALGSIHSMSVTATDFASDDYLAIDGATNGSRKIAKDSVLDVTSKNVVKYEMEGNNNNAVYHNFFALPYKIVIIKPSTTTWSDSNVSGNILAISSFNSSDTETTLRIFAKGNTIPSEIVVSVPYDSAYMRILLRADVGASVTFSYEIIDAPALNVSSENFELGNISMSASSLTYGPPSGSSGARFRTKVKRPFSLNAGDIIYAKEGYEFYVAASADGEPTYTITSGWVKRYTASNNCKVHFLLRRSPETSTTFDDLSKGFIVYSKSSEIIVNNVVVNNSNEYNLIDNKKISLTFGGSGTSNWLYKVKEPKGTLLKITHNGGNWSDSSLTSAQAKLVVQKYKADGTYQDLLRWVKGEEVPSPVLVYVQDDMESLGLFFRANSGVVVKFDIEVLNNYQLFKQSKVRGINHRGFNTIAPENTLPAFRMSAQKGFDCVETDVRTTADGYIVCIHDATIDRTSNGTGNVADKTLAQLKALDFGSWKDAAFAGTTIPTLEEFIVLCRNLGLSAYIETKSVDIEQLMNEIQGLGALDFVTIISSSIADLTYVATNYKNVRCGYVSTTFTASELSNVLALRALSVNVFVDLQEQSGDSLQRIKDNHLVYEGWVFSKARMLAADPCISGFTSDDVNAKEVFFEKDYV